jgi:hypothetical protein
VDLVRDVLDQLVVDRNGRVMGRVDGILLDRDAGRPPRLAAILMGPAVLGDRVHPVLGRWVRRVERWLGVDDGPVQIPVRDIARVDTTVHVSLAAGETAVHAVERRLRGWIQTLPGGR